LNSAARCKKQIDLREYEGILVDLDETIFEFKLSSRNGLSAMKTALSCLSNIDASTLEEELWNLDRKNLPLVFSGAITPREYRKTRLRRLIMLRGYVPSESEIDRLESIYTRAFEKEMRLCEGARDFLEYCVETKKPVAIITNGDKYTQQKTLRRLGIEKMIDILLTPNSEMEMKPNTHLFDRAVFVLGVKKEKSIMVGDSWTHDVMGALNSKIKPVWVNRRDEPVPKIVNVMAIRSIGELI